MAKTYPDVGDDEDIAPMLVINVLLPGWTNAPSRQREGMACRAVVGSVGRGRAMLVSTLLLQECNSTTPCQGNMRARELEARYSI